MRRKHITETTALELRGTSGRQSEHELDQHARAETEAGLGVPIEDVEAWVESWDTPDERPMPKARKVR